MTNQFTPEYIQYILSDEAKGLQELLSRSGEGVWFIECCQDDLVSGEWSKPHVLDEDNPTYILHYEDYEDMEFVIVPTLFDLISIIEGAGWRWQRDMDGKWLIVKGAEYHRADGWKDGDMLAAAKLAERAVEGKG